MTKPPIERDALDHWETVRRRYEACDEFIRWLEETHGLELDWSHAKPGTPLGVGYLLNQFFEVDQTRLDDQRRALLDLQRQSSSSARG